MPHRWLVVISGFSILVCLGVAYAWGVFLLPIAGEFGWSRADTSLAVSILLLVFSIFMVVGGILEKRCGPRLSTALGGVLVGLGWSLAYFTQTLGWLFITYGVVAGMGTGLAYLPSISTVIKWFPEKKGMVSGIVVCGFGIGAAFLAPLAARVIELYGWRITMLIYGVSFGVIILFASRFLSLPTQEATISANMTQNSGRALDFSAFEMIKTNAFKLIFFTYFIAMVAGMMVIGHISAFIRDIGYSATRSAFAITVLAVLNGLGRVIFGIVSDKIGRRNVLSALFFLISIAVFTLRSTNSLSLIYSAAGLIGLCFGGFLAVYPAITADFFGTKNFGINYGLVFLGYGTGCFVGTWLGGVIYDRSGSYALAFYIVGILTLFGGVLTFLLLKPPSGSRKKN
ncbi:MAG: OFA family MFS transporter [Candidatus Omnitrophica bacterium]|nr:OFA family MFS transporter [Candidatus Omnitrophota bacterium]